MKNSLLFALAAAWIVGAPAPAAAAPMKCADMLGLAMPGTGVTITKAEASPAGVLPTQPGPVAQPALSLPAYCRVDGVIDRRTGVDGKAYGIRFALALPDAWNGRFLFQGGGGLNGQVLPPVGRSNGGDASALGSGFAVVSTDTGHEGQVFDASFMRDQQASLDFAYQAVGRVAVVAKLLIARYYERQPDHSYFAGCSTGGREAMLMAQRYPTYFDGVVSGAPAMRTNFSGIGDEWVAVALNQVAPKDASGKPNVKEALSDSDRKTVIGGLLAACDLADGVKDGMIFNTKGCRFDPKTLVCRGPKIDGCLSAAQAAAIEKGFAGPKDSKGRQVYPGFLFDTGIAASQFLPGLLSGGQNPVGPPFTAAEMNVDRRAEMAGADPAGMLTATSTWTNLGTFSGHGGKLLFYHGASDPWFSALDTVDYYERMTQANGGPQTVRDWSRLYLVPGMGHCFGGDATLDNVDMLSAVVDWVEKGKAPDQVIATGRAFPGRSRPLCPYPQYARYKGTGDPEKADNFECALESSR